MEKKSLNKFYPRLHNGFEYVDLGLPSGTLWAKCNVGAEREEDYGLFFQWGDIQGYTAEQVGIVSGQKYFGWKDYKWANDGGRTMTKYNDTDGKTVLDLEDDAAHVNMGGSWVMPTKAQFEELTALTSVWTTKNGINGREFTGTNGNKLFIPAVGYASNGSVYVRGSDLYVWSSSLSESDAVNAWRLDAYSSGVDVGYYGSRYYGFGVRGVVNP